MQAIKDDSLENTIFIIMLRENIHYTPVKFIKKNKGSRRTVEGMYEDALTRTQFHHKLYKDAVSITHILH